MCTDCWGFLWQVDAASKNSGGDDAAELCHTRARVGHVAPADGFFRAAVVEAARHAVCIEMGVDVATEKSMSGKYKH